MHPTAEPACSSLVNALRCQGRGLSKKMGNWEKIRKPDTVKVLGRVDQKVGLPIWTPAPPSPASGTLPPRSPAKEITYSGSLKDCPPPEGRDGLPILLTSTGLGKGFILSLRLVSSSSQYARAMAARILLSSNGSFTLDMIARWIATQSR